MACKKLLNDARACRICEPHLPAGPRPVFQVHGDARILIAGQAPGRKVHESGIPFADPSGNRLRQWMGISDVDFYDAKKVAILPMGFCYPGTGKSGDLPPRPECAATWRAKMLAELPKIQLTLVMGQYAHAYHLEDSRKTLTDNVRAWESYWPAVLPLPHPSPRNQRWLRQNPWFSEDVIPALQNRVAEILAG